MAKESKAGKETSVGVSIGAVDVADMRLDLVGTSDLIVHKFSDRAQQKIEDKQQGNATRAPGRQKRDPERDFQESLYLLKDGRFGFPISGFKGAAVDACSFMEGQKKTITRGAFHLVDEFGEGLVAIEGSPVMRKDNVRIGMGSADMRYRGSFAAGWKVSLRIRYNKNAISAPLIVQLFNTAGFSIGVGDWRPQKDGSYGMFQVISNGAKE